MRIKTELSERPPEFTVSREGQTAVITFYTDVQEKQHEDTESVFEAVSWTIVRSWSEGLQERIQAHLEIWRNMAQSECFAAAAAEARARRDQLLADSDSLMALDRIGLSVPSGTTFTAWLSFLKKLGDVLIGDVAVYRQALRDLPEQVGFPYEINWPNKP